MKLYFKVTDWMNDQASVVRGQNGVGGFECIVRAYWSGGAGGRHGGDLQRQACYGRIAKYVMYTVA